MKKLFLHRIVVILALFQLAAQAHVQIALYDILLRPQWASGNYNAFYVMGGAGYRHGKGFTPEGERVNPLAIWQPNENTLAMVRGFNPTSEIGQLANLVNATDDGVRGHVALRADLDLRASFLFGGRIALPCDFSINTYLPVYSMRLHNLTITDLTQSRDAQDERVQRLLTRNIASLVFELGDGLQLTDWTRSGIGDWVTYLEWERNFAQDKAFLKNVMVDWRVGLSLPTGKRVDEDLLMAQAFGYDGAVAIPFGAGLAVQLGCYFTVGLDVELTHIFGSTRDRRIKTDVNQTSLLLLQKVATHKDFGMNQRFDLYFKLHDLIPTLTTTVAYQYFKHGDDQIAIKTNAFSSNVANTDVRLHEWTAHSILINFAVDVTSYVSDTSYVWPEFNVFAKIPFNGKNSVVLPMIGASLGLEF